MYFPIMINLEKIGFTIIGGGKVGYRKAEKIVNYGGKVVCISETFDTRFYTLANCHLIEAAYEKDLIMGAKMVIIATSDEALNNKIAVDCKAEGILFSNAQGADLSEFIFPSCFNRGDLCIAVSTAGASPILAQKIINNIKGIYSEEYGEVVEKLQAMRKKVIASSLSEKEKRKELKKIVELELKALEVAEEK